jgi:site-specific recombinase XerD
MTVIESVSTTVERPGVAYGINEAQLAAVSFLARYNGRTVEAYRHDLRGYFQWASDNDVAVLEATRPHIELFRAWMENRGLAASTIDRRLSTVCGFYRFAHIDGRIGSTRRTMFVGPKCTRQMHAGWTARSSVCSCSRRSSTTTTTRRWRCCLVSTDCA